MGTVLAAGLGAAAAFGAGDFSGGLATKRDPVVRVVALAHLLSLALFVVLALVTGEAAPRAVDLGWGALAGVGGVIGLASLYRGLALGPMGTVAATSAVLAAALPVLVSVLLGGHLGTGQLLGMVLALLGVTLLSRVPAEGRGGLGLAVLAGLGFGAFFVFLGQTQAGSVFWPLVMARLVSAGVMLPLAVRGPGLRPHATGPIVLSSLLDALGNVLFVVAAQTGRLAEASVLSNVYPAFTVLLALVMLRERLRVDQWWGLAATLLAVPLIAARL
nr:DMT family transporter [Deinococcus geothermalis]